MGIETRVDLEIAGIEGFVSGMSEDISVGGMFVRLAVQPAEGAPVRFGFRLTPEEPIIRGAGEVAWVRDADQGRGLEAGVAVEFLDLSDAERARIAAASRALVASLLDDDEGGETDQPPPAETVQVPVEAAVPDAVETVVGDDAEAPPAVAADETATAAAASESAVPAPDQVSIGDVTLGMATTAAAGDDFGLREGDRRRLPFPWTLLAGMAAVVVLVVSIGALVLAPRREVSDVVTDGSRHEGAGPVIAVASPSPSPTRAPVPKPAAILVDVRWSSSLRSTRVDLITDGLIAVDRLTTEALIDPPRFVVLIADLDRGDMPGVIDVEGPDVRRVHIGRAADQRGVEVILDLATSTVRVTTAVEGGRVSLETR